MLRDVRVGAVEELAGRLELVPFEGAPDLKLHGAVASRLVYRPAKRTPIGFLVLHQAAGGRVVARTELE
jgi:hypothetical protein